MSDKKHKCCTPEGQVPRYFGQKESSIEWLVEKLSNKIGKNIIVVMNDEIEKAKEMHQKEIIKAVGRGYITSSNGFPLQEAINYAEEYYKEKFGGKMSDKKHKCCTPEGQLSRYVDCVGCDKKPMESQKQSSIKWLIENAEDFFGNLLAPSIIEQAKEMHKEEIMETARYYFHERGKLTPQRYYKEKFGGNNE